MKKDTIQLIITVAVTLIINLLINRFLISNYTVHGESMYPTFEDEDRVIISKISKSLDHLDRGDVIIFHANEKKDYIKRLIGKPGDEVRYRSDQLYVNGNEVKEPYLKENKENAITQLTEDFKVSDVKGSNGNLKIPEDKYLVLGDNRQNSIDSRKPVVGLVSDEQMVGKVVLRYWPLSDFTIKFNPGSVMLPGFFWLQWYKLLL